ncbi:MAG: hypothetical protein CMG55_04895 [Candidatus Marinimicrobia bacterium]|nr:hypothetical protein [Candidatus Neomarinimicrobiota bacterium]
MKNIIKLTVIIVNLLCSIYGQTEKELQNFGFIQIATDSMDVAFFIDGFYVGNHPLKGPVPVVPGFHEVSYIPPDIQDETVRTNLTEGIKRVYVAENDTLDVFLFYDHYLTQVETLQQEMQLQKYIGFSLFGVLIYVLLSIF